MTAKWTAATNTTLGDRLILHGTAALHLSTGDLVCMVSDPNTNIVTLQLVTSHTTPSIIATVPYGSGGGTFIASSASQAFALVRDASDNLYVIGQYATGSLVAYQAFNKGPGLTWVATRANFCSGLMTGSPHPFGFTGLWCNTGGGTGAAGHVIVFVNTNGSTSGCYILDAGKMLAGGGQTGSVTTNPTCLSSATLTGGSNIDMDSDGFGVTSGCVISGSSPGVITIGAWGVTSTGLLTAGGGLFSSFSAGTLSATTKLRTVRYASNQWLSVVPSGTAGQLLLTMHSSSTGANTYVNTGTPSNFPAPSATLSWDIAAAAASLQTVWVYGWSSATATTMLRMPVVCSSGTPVPGTVVSDDTSVGTGTNTTIRTVKAPVDFLHTDWQSYDTVTPYSLLGDFSALPTPPNPPTLLTPASGTAQPLAAGFTFTWSNNPQTPGDTQASYYFRRMISGGSYEYYNAGAGTWGASFANTSATNAITFPSGKWATSSAYVWSVQVTGSLSGAISGYAGDQPVLSAATPPSTPTHSDAYDAVNNRVAITVTGTGSDVVHVYYSDDSGVTWNELRLSPITLSSGTGTTYDYEAPPGNARLYRVTQTDSTQGIYAAPSLPSGNVSVTPAITTFWLRQPGTQGNTVHVVKGSFSTQYTESITSHYGLNRAAPITVADAMHLEDGGATFWTNTVSDEANLRALLLLQLPLLLQSPSNEQWYIRITSPRPTGNRGLASPGGYKEWAVTWVTVL